MWATRNHNHKPWNDEVWLWASKSRPRIMPDHPSSDWRDLYWQDGVPFDNEGDDTYFTSMSVKAFKNVFGIELKYGECKEIHISEVKNND